MKDNYTKSSQLIAEAYKAYHTPILLYISFKINNKDEAEDLAQDVFVRLMDYKQLLREDTVMNFIYTIARNLVTDYLRHHYKTQEVYSYLYDHCETSCNHTESSISARDLAHMEWWKLSQMPTQRRKIYSMSRFLDKTAADMAEELNLCRRTVENHLFIARKEMRKYIRQCI